MAEGPRMTAAQLADKLLASEHTDVLRQSVAWIVAELMEAEVTAQVGAEFGQRTPDRLAQRNGYRARSWDTRVGELELRIPRAADRQLLPKLPGATPAGRAGPVFFAHYEPRVRDNERRALADQPLRGGPLPLGHGTTA